MEKINAFKVWIVALIGAVGGLLGWKGLMLVAWVALMALDYASGTMAALKNGEWNSKRAREGAWHKCGAIVVVLVAAIADGIMLVICGNIPMINGQWPEMLLPLVLTWYILTELGSILENAIAMGANPPTWLSKAIKAGKDKLEAKE